MMTAQTFWWAMTWACVIWYSTVTIYVAIRGAFDIKGMLARLQSSELKVECSELREPKL